MRGFARATLLVMVSTGVMSASTAAQETRRALLEEARAALDINVRLERLMEVADPGRAPIDSIWATGVHTMADLFLNMEEEALAAVWLNWVARHGREWPIDPAYFFGGVVDEYRLAVERVQTAGTDDEALATTRWDWPDALDASAEGRIEIIAADPDAPVTVAVEGRGIVSTTETLPPGTYTIDIEAEEHEPIRLTREVLPGVTTIVEANPRPLLPESVQAQVARRLVRISYFQGGQQVCTNGLLERDGFVLTVLDPSAPNASMEVTTADGTFTDVSVSDQDAGTGVVALSVPGASGPSLDIGGMPSPGSFAWSVHRVACPPDLTSSRTRVPEWPPVPAGLVGVSTPFDGGAVGAPVVDRSGGVIGLVAAGDQVAPISMAQQLVETVIAQRTESPQVPPVGGGSSKWKWIGGAGAVGAAGILAALLLGGDSGGSDSGTIVIQIPGG